MKRVKAGLRLVLAVSLLPAASFAASAVDTIPDGPQSWSAPPFWSPPPASLGSGREALVVSPVPLPFVAITPCRQYDSRNDALLMQSTPRTVALLGAPCGIPPDAQAVAATITVMNINATSNGVFKAGTVVPPTVAWINYPPTETQRGNAGVLPLGAGGTIVVQINQGSGSVDFTVDVFGYYSPLGVVNSLNGQAGDLTLAAGANVTLTPNGQTLTIATSVPAGPTGPIGPTGPTGATGATGQPGADAVYVGVNWGVINRNTIGSPVGVLRAGPFGSFGVVDTPPNGVGSLGIEVADGTAKVAFGNEVDFFNMNVSALTAVGFNVFTTGENSQTPVVPVTGTLNMPGITFEINPHGAGGTSTTYSSLVFMPAANSTANRWSGYIDATTTGFWG